ncbi:hypothetical protein MTP04_12830 [Lysinibacillus sp. PLM2]|nr:hypothetical protein MTP04_12830 [Lysinibacillus sp. PLM2]
MTKNVKNSARPIMTWFGGMVFVASAVLVKDSTITIRAKEVININILGASERTVNRSSNCMDVDTFVGSLLEK